MRTIAMLRSGELCVCQITEVLQLAQSTVSSHLRELRFAGLLTERKEGRWVYFGLTEEPDATPWIETALKTLADDPQLSVDDRLVAELRNLPVEDLCRLGYEEARARAESKNADKV